MMNEPYLHSARKGLQLFSEGKLSAVDWTQSILNRIEAIDSDIKAWAYRDGKGVLERADASDKKQSAGAKLGILEALPCGIKDIFNTADMPTEMGSPIWKGFTPGNDARVVTALRTQGANPVGKTVTAEFAVHTPGETRNPHHLDYSPGTSSSGSAAAVASFMAPFALGSQTAGSITRPASYCGVWGFKPSFGVFPRTGTLKTTDTLDTIGYFVHEADDLELFFDVLRVQGRNYPFVHDNFELRDAAGITKKADEYTVGILSDTLKIWENTQGYAREAFFAWIESLKSQGITIKEISLPPEVNQAHEVHSVIYDKTLSYYFKEEFKQHTLVSPLMYKIIENGNRLQLKDYQKALIQQSEIATAIEEAVADVDLCVTLSTAGSAPLFGQDDIPDSCLIWTLAHMPSLNIPMFRGPKGLPFGAQVIAPRFNDRELFRFARTLKQLFPDSLELKPAEDLKNRKSVPVL